MNQEGYFRSHGYSVIKVTRIDENGEMKGRVPRDRDLSTQRSSCAENCITSIHRPETKTMRLINKNTGKEFMEEGLTLDQAKNDPNYGWSMVYDKTDSEYLKAVEKRTNDISILVIMICLDMVEEFGIDKMRV